MKRSTLNRHAVRVPVFVIIVLLVSFTARSVVADLTAVVTKENDFTIDDQPVGKTVAVPVTVAQKIEGLVDAVYSRWICKPGAECHYKRDDFYGPVFRIAAPKGLELYVFRQNASFSADFFFFILFDPVTKKVTQDPPYTFAKWMGCCGLELKTSLLSFEDVDGDGHEEIVVQEQVHNGTMYNAVVYHYYHVSADLALHPILAVETRLIDMVTESKGGIITRRVKKLAKGRIQLDVLLDFRWSSFRGRKLGEVVLMSSKPGKPFTVERRRIFDRKYTSMIITGSDENESTFLKDGYRFYY